MSNNPVLDEESIPDSPYRGLTPYREIDAPLFFGRETERENIISNLMGSRLTLLYGPTGVGKSSVLRAGVAYRLNLLARENIKKYGKPEFAIVVFDKWQGEPLLTLHESIRSSVAKTLDNPGILQSEPSLNLTLALQDYSELMGGDLLIILDQFEEYFLYHGGREEEISFAMEFARAINRAKLRVSFLISIREDALAKLDVFKGKIPGLFDNYLRIQPLSSHAAQEAIRKPLEVYSALTKVIPKFTIEDELVDEVCRQVETGNVIIGETGYGSIGDKPDKSHVETSFLQLVMTRLWEYELNNRSHRLRLTTLKALGGAESIVKTHLDLEMEALPNEEQDIAAEVFRYLVTPSGTKIAYTASDLAKLTESPQERITSVLDKLGAGDTRILRPFFTNRPKASEKNYEIFHDVLAPAILYWRAKYIGQRERAKIELEARKRHEQERARRKSRNLVFLLILSAIITALMATLYIYAERQRRIALLARAEAESQRAEAESQKVESQKILTLVNNLDRSVPFFMAIMRGHLLEVVSVDFSPDGKRIVTASKDKTARVWEADTGNVIKVLTGHEKGVNNALFSSDGKLIVTASSDHTVRVWDANTLQTVYVLEGHSDGVSSARFSPDSKLIVTASIDGTARVWSADTGHTITVLRGHSGAVTDAEFSPDNQFIVTSSTDGTALIWNAQTGVLIARLEGHRDAVNAAAFNPNGRLVVTASSDGEARLWDASDGRLLFLLKHSGAVNSAAFSPNGNLIVTSSNDKTAKVWDVKSSRMLNELKGHSGEVLKATFSRDSARIITASADNTARVWDANSGKVLFELRGHISRVNSAVFSLQAELVATASEDNTARTWDTAGAGGLRITNISVNVVPDTYNGMCPVRVRFIARITVAGSGTIKYRFIRNNVKTDEEGSLEFESSCSKEVSLTRILGGKKFRNLSGSFHLEIISPQSEVSDEATYNIRCQFPSAGLPQPL